VAVDLYAYGDESGINPGAKYCLLLGYVGSPRQWALFSKKWSAVVDTLSTGRFHAIDFFTPERRASAQNPYRGWTPRQDREFLDALLDALTSVRVLPVGWAVDVAAFHALRKDERRYLTGAYLNAALRADRNNPQGDLRLAWLDRRFQTSGAPQQAYFVALVLFFTDIYRAMQNDAAVHVVLDTQKQYEPWALQLFMNYYHDIRDNDGKSFADLRFASSRREPSLQAADLYAYVWNRYLAGTMTPDLRHALKRLASQKRVLLVADAAYFSETLDNLRSNMEAEDSITMNRQRSLEVRRRWRGQS